MVCFSFYLSGDSSLKAKSRVDSTVDIHFITPLKKDYSNPALVFDIHNFELVSITGIEINPSSSLLKIYLNNTNEQKYIKIRLLHSNGGFYYEGIHLIKTGENTIQIDDFWMMPDGSYNMFILNVNSNNTIAQTNIIK